MVKSRLLRKNIVDQQKLSWKYLLVPFLTLELSGCANAQPGPGILTVARPQVARAETEISTAKSFVICKNSGQIRTLRVQPQNQNPGCSTVYSKDGRDQSIGNSRSQSHCMQILDSVRKNLEDANWRCRDVKEAKFSDLTPETNSSISR